MWREHLERHGRTPQHIGIRVDDYEAAMRDAAARGWTELQTGRWPGGRYAYVDATAELGVVVEYLWSER